MIWAAFVFFSALLVVAAASDAVRFTIPNWISLALIAGFLALAGFFLPLGQLGLHLAVGLGALAAGVALFALGWIGGGDAKLAAAVALWAGAAGCVAFIAWTAVAGGVLSLVLMIARRLARWLRADVEAGPALLRPGQGVPYGIAIAGGALMAAPSSGVFQLVFAA